jgi:hypothetical protein
MKILRKENYFMLVSRIKTFDYKVKSLTPIQQALTAVFCLLTIQYTANFLAYNELLPLVFGKDPNGIIKNTSFVVPGILAIVFSIYFEGLKGIVRIFKPYTVWKLNVFYWVFIIFIMFPMIYVGLIACDLILMRGIQPHELMWGGWDNIIKYTPIFAGVAISDELFWIGFVLPRLVKGGLSPLNAAFLMGALWALDYIPYVYTGFFLAPGVEVITVILGTFALTPWYVWLYYRTGSALILLVFNLFAQYSQNIVPMLPHDNGGSNIEAICAVVTFFIFGLLLWKLMPLSRNLPESTKF